MGNDIFDYCMNILFILYKKSVFNVLSSFILSIKRQYMDLNFQEFHAQKIGHKYKSQQQFCEKMFGSRLLIFCFN